MPSTATRRVIAPEDETTRASRDAAYDELRTRITRRHSEWAADEYRKKLQFILAIALVVAVSFYALFG